MVFLYVTPQVNNQDIVGWSHETAAKALKTAGTEVTLRVVYKPEGWFLLRGFFFTSSAIYIINGGSINVGPH